MGRTQVRSACVRDMLKSRLMKTLMLMAVCLLIGRYDIFGMVGSMAVPLIQAIGEAATCWKKEVPRKKLWAQNPDFVPHSAWTRMRFQPEHIAWLAVCLELPPTVSIDHSGLYTRTELMCIFLRRFSSPAAMDTHLECARPSPRPPLLLLVHVLSEALRSWYDRPCTGTWAAAPAPV